MGPLVLTVVLGGKGSSLSSVQPMFTEHRDGQAFLVALET